MHDKTCNPFLECGNVFDIKSPLKLAKIEEPITIAKVKVNPQNLKMPCVLLNYSQNLSFQTTGFNATLIIVYRLVRTSTKSKKAVLEEWTYQLAENIPTPVPDTSTIEPLILNFCDCLSDHNCGELTYEYQIASVTTNNTTFDISKQEVSAIVSCGSSEE